MELGYLGYSEDLERFRTENDLTDFEVGRVTQEHKERYVVRTEKNEYEAEITGNMRFSAESRQDFPAVGDWVALTVCDSDFAIIHKIFPRKTILERQAVAKFGESQIIAANIDYVFITNAVDRDFNINRIERYLTICNSAKAEPIVLLTKTDLIPESELNKIISDTKNRLKNILIIPISNQTKSGYDKFTSTLQKGKTYCFLGSSGVGKSSLINNLTGKEVLKTFGISTNTGKGRHTTTHRELVVLENGSILIDNPGMREIGIADTTGGLEITFDSIIKLSQDCKFSDCTHTVEKGCAVIDAVEKEIIDKDTYKNYLKMEREKIHYQSSVYEKRKKDKAFGKMVNEVMKIKKKSK
ncbi:MAG: ribosome small subunit-dependent GTPase A [Ignavibacteriae bacterium]|nr:ribosome small subunit-dependent GTPase A [Ignavibacteriota bacterium]